MLTVESIFKSLSGTIQLSLSILPWIDLVVTSDELLSRDNFFCFRRVVSLRLESALPCGGVNLLLVLALGELLVGQSISTRGRSALKSLSLSGPSDSAVSIGYKHS